ncbi:MAG: FliO/MopB family protein [Bdellovibrionota bacterium]
MKFIRKARRRLQLRDQIVDVLSKALLIGISVLACLWMVSGAHAASISITGIKGEAQNDGAYAIDFSLSQKISADDVAVEFDRNFIQISLKGVSAYPARTENINQGTLEKVFTYQYQPDLARARVLLKASANTVKAKSTWEITNHGIRVLVKGAHVAAAAVTDTVKSKAAASDQTALSTGDADDEKIVQQILAESKNGAKAAPLAAAAPAAKVGEESPLFGAKAASSNEDQQLFAPKAAESKPKETTATRIVASLLLVIGVIGACAVGFRRFALGKGNPFQRQNRVIETIATQGLGPKRSVAVIKVLDQYLVVGMSGDGMNLLANLGSDIKIDKYLDQIGGPGSSFTDTLEGALAGVTAAGKTDTAGPPLTSRAAEIELGIRSSIKKRIAGFKPL